MFLKVIKYLESNMRFWDFKKVLLNVTLCFRVSSGCF